MQDLNVQININALLEEARSKAEERIQQQLTKYFNTNIDSKFASGNHFGQAKGDAYKIVESEVNKYINSPEFVELCSELAVKYAYEAADKAVKTSMNHLARKLVFSKLDN